MDDSSTMILLATAANLGFLHTLLGIDHSLPFVVLARAQRWSLRRLWTVTALCGVAHVLSSVLLGAIGIGIGMAVEQLAWIEAFRGDIAAHLLIVFGTAYAAWAMWQRMRGRRHAHVHAYVASPSTVTTMTLVVVFVLGPCEVLIPVLWAPATEHHGGLVAAVAGLFGLVTVGTMLALVTLGWWGLQWRGLRSLEHHVDTMAGLAIAASGMAIAWLGM